jgi:pimeloyl-ACP methyl ester carboxylesterase
MRKLIHYMTERKQHRKRWVEILQDTLVPLHLIYGLLDPISGEHMVKRFEELIPNASVTTIAGTGHYPQIENPQIENPQVVLDSAMEFWNTQNILIKT